MNRFLSLSTIVLIAGVGLLTACRDSDQTTTATPGTTTPPINTNPTTTSTGNPTFQSQTVLTGYEVIWGMDFLPDGTLLFTEKRGRIYRHQNGTTTQLVGLPTDIDAGGQGGLLDLRVHPNYATTGWIYATYSGIQTGSNGTRLNLIRFKITGNQLTDLSTIFRTSATNTWRGHYGGRIEFDRTGLLFLAVGEGGPGSYGGANAPNQNGQTLTNEWGKIHRLTDAGNIPTTNPVLPGQSGPTSIYSYGHRNPQGLALNPTTGELWATEHGPRGGDEVNIVRAGLNYGWPLVSYGVNYDGVAISSSPTRQGVENPVFTWTPSMGPCGLTFLTNDRFKSWKGDLIGGGLALRYLSRLDVTDNRVAGEERLLNGEARVRHVRQGPDGNLYVSIESPGRIIRLVPD